MKKLLASPDSTHIGLLKGMLDVAGIPCEVRNEAVSQTLPGSAFDSELWVLHDEDYPRAVELIDASAS